MTNELTEEELIELLSEDGFNDLARRCLIEMSKSFEFKNDLPTCALLIVFPVKDRIGSSLTLVVNCSATKKHSPFGPTAGDFGFEEIWISDEEMPDIALDRYNDYLKLKNKS